MATLGFLCSKTALKAAAAETTPWQTYLDKAPVQAEQFAADPLGTLLRLFAAEPVQLLREVLHQYAGVLLFLFGKGEWRNRNEKSVKIRNEEIGKIEERRNQEDKRVSYAFSTSQSLQLSAVAAALVW